jgi:hypothetical protein
MLKTETDEAMRSLRRGTFVSFVLLMALCAGCARPSARPTTPEPIEPNQPITEPRQQADVDEPAVTAAPVNDDSPAETTSQTEPNDPNGPPETDRDTATDPPQGPIGPEEPIVVLEPVLTPPRGFGPTRIEILPLTELVPSSYGQPGTRLRVYVTLLDAFASSIKAPGTFRFELYEYVQRSADPKGTRLAIWPDLDLTEAAANNNYWRDFLRAYEFELTARASRDQSYVLEATCLYPGERRLSTEFILRPEL